MVPNFVISAWVCGLAFCLMTGCETFGPRSSATTAFSNFRSATKNTSAQFEVVVGQLNKVERDALIENAIAEGDSLKLGQIEKVQVFSPGDIDVLIKSGEILDRYSELLLTLASSDAATSVSGRVSALGSSLVEFQSDSRTIDVGNAKVREVRSACGVLSKIASEASKWIVQHNIDKTLDKVIIESDPSIQRLVGSLEDCMDVAAQRTETTLSQARVNVIAKMQRLKSSAPQDADSFSLMEKLADDLKHSYDNLSNFKRSNPTSTLAELKRAHAALVLYAKSDHTSKDFAELVTVLEEFSRSAERGAKTATT